MTVARTLARHGCCAAIALALCAASATALGAGGKVRLLAGGGKVGEIVALDAERVTLRESGAETSLPAAELMWVEMAPALEESKPTTWVELLDGSKLQAMGYMVAADQARVELSSGETVQVPTRAIKSVRFRPHDSALALQWREILASKATGDLLVVRKTSMRPVQDGENEGTSVTEVALDTLDGAVLDVGPESVQFEFDGDKIDVRREKLDGIIYYHPASREYSAPACRLIDVGGSAWSLKSVELAAGRLRGNSLGGVAIDLPVASVAKIDYSVGNVAMLAELEPDTGGGDPTVSLQPAAMAFKFGRVFGVRSGPPLGASSFQIDGVRYDNGLSLHSPAALVYRVPEGMRKLRAVAGVDDSVLAPGNFDLVVLADGKESFRHAFRGNENRQPVSLDLDIAGVKRISIVLDPADGQDIGDQLDLCEARLTK